jgi:hypothetical protein
MAEGAIVEFGVWVRGWAEAVWGISDDATTETDVSQAEAEKTMNDEDEDEDDGLVLEKILSFDALINMSLSSPFFAADLP